MRISDWSSDVCSSDLVCADGGIGLEHGIGQANDGVQVALLEQMLLEPGLHAFAEQGSVREHHRRNTTRAKQADEQREEQVSRLTGAQIDRKSTRLNSSH